MVCLQACPHNASAHAHCVSRVQTFPAGKGQALIEAPDRQT